MTRRRSVVLGAIVLGLVAWGVTRCVRRAENGLGIRAVVLVTLDTVRVDRLGAYGSKLGATPTLDRLAAKGVRFERCLTVAPITLPAHATLLTGQDPIEHGVRLNGAFALDPTLPTLATLLRGHGFETGAFVSAFVLDRRFGLDQGFDVYDDRFENTGADAGFGTNERRGERTVDRALAFVDQVGDSPFFIWVHLYDAHAAYEAPAEFAARFPEPYDAEVAYVDACVKRLIDGLDKRGRLGDALVSVVADHGEGLGDHGEKTHTLFLYDTTMHVPWIVSAQNKLPHGRVVTPTVSSTAVAPTLLDLLGIERPPEMTGAALGPLVQGKSETLPQGAFVRIETQAPAYYYGFAAMSGAEVDGAKLIVAPRPELYVPREDPRELDDRFARERPRADAAKRLLDAFEAKHATGRSHRHEIDAEDEEKLAQLGYLSGHSTPSTRDPKDGIALFDALIDAGEKANSDPALAEQALVALLAREPDVAEAHELLGDVRMRLKDFDRARAAYLGASRLRPKDPVLYTKLGEAHGKLGHVDEARKAFELAVAFDPTAVRPRVFLAGILEATDRPRALALYTDVLARSPLLAAARFGRARCLRANGNARLAEQDIRRGLDTEPGNAAMWVECGHINEELLQNVDAAAECYKRVLALPIDETLRAEIAARLKALEH